MMKKADKKKIIKETGRLRIINIRSKTDAKRKDRKKSEEIKKVHKS
jgi:ribosomal protein L36